MNKSAKNEAVELSMRGDKKVVDVIPLGNNEFFNDFEDEDLLDICSMCDEEDPDCEKCIKEFEEYEENFIRDEERGKC